MDLQSQGPCDKDKKSTAVCAGKHHTTLHELVTSGDIVCHVSINTTYCSENNSFRQDIWLMEAQRIPVQNSQGHAADINVLYNSASSILCAGMRGLRSWASSSQLITCSCK